MPLAYYINVESRGLTGEKKINNHAMKLRTKIEIDLFLTRQDVHANEHVHTISELRKCTKSPWMFFIFVSA